MLLFFLFLFCTEASFGQKISQRRLRKHRAKVYASKVKGTVMLSLDTIFNKGMPYAILIKFKEMPYHRYMLYSLDKKELASIQSKGSADPNGNGYYSFRFCASEKIAEPEKYITFKLEKEIVACDLVDGNKINPFSEIKFLKKYPRKFSNPGYVSYVSDEQTVNTNDIYAVVKRDTDKQIYASDGNIHQDYKLIGRYKITDGVMRIYLPAGLMIAEATENEDKAGIWDISSMKDKKKHTLPSYSGKILEGVINFLVENLYL